MGSEQEMDGVTGMRIQVGNRFRRRLALGLAVLCLLAGGVAAFAEDDVQYVENQWNFVDGALDVSGGIPEDAQGVLRKIRDRGVLRVATEPYFAPQEFIDPDLEGQASFVGADMDLARLIAQRMGVELEIVPMEFTEVLGAVSEGVCDLAISALSFTPSRAAANAMSKGYYFAESGAGAGVLIRAEDQDTIRTVEDLADKVLVAQSGSVQEALAAENIPYYLEFRRLSSITDLYEAVAGGKADAACVDAETAAWYIRENPEKGLALAEGIRFTLEEAFQGDRIAGKKEELQLMYFVNGVINEVLEKDLYTSWLEDAKKRAAELGL